MSISQLAKPKPDDYHFSFFVVGILWLHTGTALVDEDRQTGIFFWLRVVVAGKRGKKIEGALHLRTTLDASNRIVTRAEGGLFGRNCQATCSSPLGSGESIMDEFGFISKDLCKLVLLCWEKPHCKGIYNALGPNPATNYQLDKSGG